MPGEGRLSTTDAHAHSTELKGLEGALGRAEQAGVLAIIAVGMNLQSNLKTLQIAVKYGNSPVRVLPALGLHPWGLREGDVDPAISHMKQNAASAAGVGEVGLDYWVRRVREDPRQKQVQQHAFKEAIDVAKLCDKPLTVHSRGAWGDCYSMAVDSGVKRAVFHWFSGPPEIARRIVDHGFFISATPAVEYSKEHRAAISETPLENLLLETDSPVKYGNLVAEPKDVAIALREVSRLKGVEEKEVAEKTAQNFGKLYGLHRVLVPMIMVGTFVNTPLGRADRRETCSILEREA